MSSVYVMKNELGLVKIGNSKNPKMRQKQLCAASGFSVEIEHVFETDKAWAIEHAAHGLLAERRKVGEWFDISVSDAVKAIYAASKNSTITEKASKESFSKKTLAEKFRIVSKARGASDDCIEEAINSSKFVENLAELFMGLLWENPRLMA